MKQNHAIFFVLITALLVGLFIISSPAQAELLARTQAQSGAPPVVSYQGQVMVGGQPFNGTGYFKLAVVNQTGDTIYWTNDGSLGSEPAEAITLPVSEGFFNVLLGDTTIPNMVALSASVFSGTDRYLRVWFSPDGSTFTLLSPDRRIAAAPYALQAEEAKDADLLDGQDANAFASSAHNHDHGSLSGLGDDDHPQYFRLLDNETVTGIPAFNGGVSGSSAPFSVDSNTLVTNLNADLLDGQHAYAFANSTHNHWGQTWTGSGTGLALSGGTIGLSGIGSSSGVLGSSSTTGARGVEGVSTATSGGGAGVYGQGDSATGYGGSFYNSSLTGYAVAVYGYTDSTSGIAGFFLSDNDTAGTASSGVYGRDDSDDGFGVAGHNYYGGVGIGAWSYNGHLIEAYDGDYPGGTLRFYVDQAGNVYADGIFGVYGASTLDGMMHASSTLQSTEAWLEDFGRARLVDGAAVVLIATDFAGMADLSLEYHVFLTPLGDSQGLYVSNLTPTSFEVHEQGGGKSGIEFSYRIVARPGGGASMRLPQVDIPTTLEGVPERLPEGEK